VGTGQHLKGAHVLCPHIQSHNAHLGGPAALHLHERQAKHQGVISCIPIISSVLLVTIPELTFDMWGLINTFIAMLCLSLQNVFSKKVLSDSQMHHLQLLNILGCHSLLHNPQVSSLLPLDFCGQQ
jgi:hypothetical protein